MAAIDLSFVKEGNAWVADMQSPGKCIVQIERMESGWTTVFTKIDDLRFAEVADFPDGSYKSEVIFELNIPAGMNIRIQSNKEVKNAKYIVEE